MDSVDRLQSGWNVLGIHIFNHATDHVDILTRPELILSADTNVFAPIFYTLDGSDPREPGGASVGVSYNGELTLSESSTVKARALLDGDWSALNVATFVVNPVELDDVVVSEINYNPAVPTPAELATIETLDKDDFEFIELYNRGENTIDLLGAKFTDGVDFEFPAYELVVGERAVIVRDIDAFRLRYGENVSVIGEFDDGGLSNGGEGIAIVDRLGNTLVEFEYDDTRLWPQHADGVGGTIELISADQTPSDELGKAYRWHGSSDFGGSPGTAGSDQMGVKRRRTAASSEPIGARHLEPLDFFFAELPQKRTHPN